MADTGFTLEQLRALEAAYASGVLSVEYDGKRTVYRSLSDLAKAIQTVRAALGAQAGSPPPVARVSTFRRN